MFDLRDGDLTKVKRAESPIPDSPAPTEGGKESGPLDSPKALQTWMRLLDCYVQELSRQEPNRTQQAREEDFYDGIQWDENDAAALKERGQQPLVYNVIATTVNWVLGTEKRARADYHVLPRRKEDAKPAERKSQLLKYLSDCNKTPFHKSRAFGDSVKVGIGWLEDCIEQDGEGEPIRSRYENWRNMLWDSAATELCLKDARYIFRSKWVDLDIAAAIFTNRKAVLDLAARDADPMSLIGDFGDEAMDRAEKEMEDTSSSHRLQNLHFRQRVRIIEAWFKVPETVDRLQGGVFSGELFDPSSPGHVDTVDSGEASIITKVAMKVYCALFTTTGLLWLGPSPYRHNRYPFTPVWGNKRGRDGLPYGLIRGLMDPQMDLNKRAAKALYLLSVKRKIADEGAAEDMEELFDELDRTDSRVIKKAGKEVRVETEHNLADAHVELMRNDITMIQQVGGVTDENLGRRTNATSGIAIERRQDQGSLTTWHYYDNYRFASQEQGEKELSLIEQWMTEKKQFRITNMRGKPEYQVANDGLPENDIIRSKADYVITEADWKASIRQAAGEQLMELLIKLAPVNPQLVAVMLDLAVESMDISNREEIVQRIRQLTGMSDPDAEQPTEEEVARKQAAAKQQQLQEATVEATLRKLLAEAENKEASTAKTLADAVVAKIKAIGGPKRGAIDIGADLMTRHDVAAVVDEILRDAGYVTRTEQETTAALADAAAVAARQQGENRAPAVPPGAAPIQPQQATGVQNGA